jgi:MFS transporter, DHA1 family, tetracycline resistance protein
MAGVVFCTQLAHHVLPACSVLYAGYRYNWDALGVGGLLALVGVTNAIVQALLIRPTLARFGDIIAMVIGLVGGTIGFAWYGLAPTGLLFLLGTPMLAIWGLAGPPGQALMSRRVGADQQGALQGAIGSIQGVAGLIGPTLFTQVFAFGIGTAMPGLPFFVSSVLLSVGAFIVVTVVRKQKMPGQAAAPAEA